jgi:microcystin-dependent protein
MDPFVAEIRIVPFNFAPKGWSFCDGQILPILQNTALFSLLGTVYGGDGQSTFGLPNFQGSVPIGSGQGSGLNNYALGQTGGEQAVALISNEIPSHVHQMQAVGTAGTKQSPSGNSWASSTTRQFSGLTPNAAMGPTALSVTGSSQPHNNMMPFLTLNFIIAMQGIFPPRS